MKKFNLYQKLKPLVKSNIKEKQLKYEYSVADIFKFLTKKEDYIDLTIREVNSLILFSNTEPKDVHELRNGDFAFRALSRHQLNKIK